MVRVLLITTLEAKGLKII